MIETTRGDAPGTPAALSAFLRGIERRGAVFAELHCGDAIRGDQGLALALRMFNEHARAQPFPRWPGLFWRALLATPQLRTGAPSPYWPGELAALGKLGNGPRAALLLRLVAGLGDGDAAEALGVAPATYRLALRQALPRDADGQADAAAWRALADAVQARLRDVPAARLAHLARLREAAVQGRRPDLIGPLPEPRVVDEARPSRWVRGALWAGFAACVAALVLSFAWPSLLTGIGPADIRVRALPAAEAPAARYDAELALLTERDFELLVEGEALPPRDDPAFYAWYAAQMEAGATPDDPDAGMRDPIPVEPSPSAQPETTDVF